MRLPTFPGLLASILAGVLVLPGMCPGADDLAADFAAPPLAARTRCYWWWLNGNVDKAAITKDLEWMKAIGMGGGLIFDASMPAGPTPTGPLFGSPAWTDLFVHALREADRLGLELSLSPQSGWNLGGPTVTPEEAGKVIAWSELRLSGPQEFAGPLPQAQAKVFRDTVVLAYRLRPGAGDPGKRAKPIRDLKLKAVFGEQGGSGSDSRPLLEDLPATPGEEDAQPGEVLDLTDRRQADGSLRWSVPAGDWQVLRFGWTLNGGHVSTSSGAWKGLVVDYLDADALRSYWRQVVTPLLDAAGPLASRSLTGIETDSWEGGGLNWSKTLPAAFRRLRGYALEPWLPVVAGRIIGDRDRSNRFLADLRKTIGALMAEQNYQALADLAGQRGLGTHCEAGGPHGGPFDALANLGRQTMPMGEFWVKSPHRPTEDARYFMKTPASAAHLYGKRIACGEGFTSIGPHWNDVLWSNHKPTFDHEACAGLNLTYWHAFTCSPASAGIPGQEYFAGTHFNPQITWASMASGVIGYLNRCQALLQRGRPMADVLVYVGDQVPNVPIRKQAAPAGILPGYDFDWCNEEALLTRIRGEDGRLVLPDGVSYRVLILPDHGVLSLPVARTLRDLAKAGVAIIGPRPTRTASLSGWPASEAELQAIADQLWRADGIVPGRTAAEVLARRGVVPDVAWPAGQLDWIHRRDGEADLYFLSNQDQAAVRVPVTFRVGGRQPEIWDPLTGTRREATAFTQADGVTTVPLDFAPYGSVFVVFRRPIAPTVQGTTPGNAPDLVPVGGIDGPWKVAFSTDRGGPGEVAFPMLVVWTAHGVDPSRHYSGVATYRTTFDRPAGPGPFTLDLGQLAEMAQVSVNGADLGILWTPPYRAVLPASLKPTGNQVEIRVANTWMNRLLADQALPADRRVTRTHVVPKKGTQPLPSGLLGPVRLLAPVDR